MKIRLLKGAESDMRTAAAWYEKRQAGLGEGFLQELTRRLKDVELQPRQFGREECHRTERDVRFCRLGRFPYRIVFEIREPWIVILAVAHARRRPGYWKRRR
jgi:plasmid stabilization system protein ParE